MTPTEAIEFIKQGILPTSGVWIDIGAGTGVFTRALFSLLTSGNVIAVDKNPHALYSLRAPLPLSYEIIEADFTKEMDLPFADGIIMANALHYAKDQEKTLSNIIQHLRPGGTFLLIEYDNTITNQWVPYPVPILKANKLLEDVGIIDIEVINKRKSGYGQGTMYLLSSRLRSMTGG